MSTDRRTAFRALHHGPEPLLLPNAWDHASAAAFVEAGFPAVGTTSLGVAAAHGLPDGAGLVRAQTLALARRLATLPIPVTVDAEAGFADDPAGVAAFAAELAAVGIAGLNLEDGRPDGQLADPAAQAERIAAVHELTPELFLNARVDTHWLVADPPPLSAAIDRAARYVAAGADGIFVPGLAAEDDIVALVAAVPVPVNVLCQPGRHTPARLGELGVRRVSTGSLLFRAALDAAVATATAVRAGRPIQDVLGYAEVQGLATL